ncbi:elongation of very long chain fatty acids protein 1-like isoform X2 [Leptopilina boulardi]|uniref:elongation of very long chain fatty acids protein 1-like isoform X2 n=1 Tax=Leptopilina boulardi TaxID=63433 RepID=UPI0021F5BEE1|nr:elongation of very long chain fatty acids protein 1-like isoform X2 [Leptopilina boulardi]
MGLLETFNYYYYDLADQRIRDWFLMNSIWYPIIITLIYILMVFKLAPAYMKNRPAYKLNTYIKCYNLFQVFSNAYIAMEASLCYPFLRSFECRPIVYKTDPCSMMILKCGYIGMLLKLIDLTETVVYILRPIKEMIIPFKRYMTLIQMGQFVIVLVQILVIMIPGCDKLPKFLIYTMFVNIIFNFCLFYRFYKDTYINIKKKN